MKHFSFSFLIPITLIFAIISVAADTFADDAVSPRGLSIEDILKGIESATTCVACEAILLSLKALAHLGNSPFVSTLTGVCQLLKVEDDDVCAGTMEAEGPIVAHDLREIPIGGRTSKIFCATLFGLCPIPNVEEYAIKFPKSKPKTVRPDPSGATPIQVVHISDIHVDRTYEVGSNYNCTKPICCHSYTAADAPGNTSYPAGEFGNVQCDSPPSLEDSLYSAIETLVPNKEFAIFTGDVPEHFIWGITEAQVAADINDAFRLMQKIGLTYAAIGNHESSPANSFPPAAVDTTYSSQWVYNNLSASWDSWIGGAAASEAESTSGSYSVVHGTSNLRIISINTIFWYKLNLWMYEADMERDPSGQFAWLVTQLQAAEDAGQRVWIIGHLPLGDSDAFHDASQYMDQIVQRYDATIAALFFGHTHVDQFQIAYSNWDARTFKTASMVSYIAPSLTPTSGNPSFRVYSVDPVTFGVLDVVEYYANISSPTYQSSPTWEVLYSAKEAYGSLLTPPVTDPKAELTPAFWHNVTTVFETNDTAFGQYYSRLSRGHSTATCDADCKTLEICHMRASQSQYNCDVVTPGIHISKRDETTGRSLVTATSGECDGNKFVPIMNGIVSDMEVFKKALAEQVDKQ